jgi:tetratricopeptide (TPR) repeat protein
MLAERPDDERALELLSKVDPAQAAAHIERLLATNPAPDDLRHNLIELWTGMGNTAGAESLLDKLTSAGQAVGADEWGQVAESWLEQGDSARASATFLRALAQEHGDPDEWVHPLEDLAPAELLTVLERRVSSDAAGNDEYWGSLADSYWRAGRPTDARAAWEHARALDADDEEWPARLEALDRGEDPFGD